MMETVPRGTNARKRKAQGAPFLKGSDSDGVFSRQTCSGGTASVAKSFTGVKHLTV